MGLLYRKIIKVVLAAIALFFIAWLSLKTFIRFPRGWIEDDAFFYAQIAYNIGTTYFSTFDGIHQTSGYHLLWGWLLGFTAWVTSFFSMDKELHLVTMLTLYFGICSIVIFQFGQTLKQRILLAGTFLLSSVLMETALLALLLLIIIDAILKKKNLNLLVGFAFFTIPLTRIDASLIPLLLSFCYLKEQKKSYFLISEALVLLGALVHLCSMKIIFGHFASVSSLSKLSAFSSQGFFLSGLLSFRHLTFLGLVLLMGLSVGKQKDNKIDLSIIFLAITLYMGIHFFINSNVRSWYFLPSYLIFAYLAKWLDFSILRRITVCYLSFLISVYICYKSAVVFHYYADGVYLSSESFLMDLRKIVPKDEPIFQVDGSGYVGYFSNRMVVNGDGLVNSYDFLKWKKNNALANYLKQENISYIITNQPIEKNIILNTSGLIVRSGDVTQIINSKIKAPYTDFRLFRINSNL